MREIANGHRFAGRILVLPWASVFLPELHFSFPIVYPVPFFIFISRLLRIQIASKGDPTILPKSRLNQSNFITPAILEGFGKLLWKCFEMFWQLLSIYGKHTRILFALRVILDRYQKAALCQFKLSGSVRLE